MGLNTSKLIGWGSNGPQRGRPTRTRSCGKVEFQCPACAAEGHDKGYDHLVIYKDGIHYGCSKYNLESGLDAIQHRDQIWKMVGIGKKAGRPEPFISPRKITKNGTLLAKHDADIATDRRITLKLREEHNAKVAAEKEEQSRLLTKALIELNKEAEQPTQHIVVSSNQMSNGTFGTPFSFSHQSPTPLYNNKPNGNTVKTIPPHVPTTSEKPSQTSHFRSWREVAGPEDCKETEEYSGEFGLAFNRNNPKWREHYYLWYRSKYYGEAVAF